MAFPSHQTEWLFCDVQWRKFSDVPRIVRMKIEVSGQAIGKRVTAAVLLYHRCPPCSGDWLPSCACPRGRATCWALKVRLQAVSQSVGRC
jgi:hypothetical protein